MCRRAGSVRQSGWNGDLLVVRGNPNPGQPDGNSSVDGHVPWSFYTKSLIAFTRGASHETISLLDVAALAWPVFMAGSGRDCAVAGGDVELVVMAIIGVNELGAMISAAVECLAAKVDRIGRQVRSQAGGGDRQRWRIRRYRWTRKECRRTVRCRAGIVAFQLVHRTPTNKHAEPHADR